MTIADRLRAFADLLDERDARPSRFRAAGDEHTVVLTFRVLGAGNELILSINQPFTQVRQSRLALDAVPKLDLPVVTCSCHGVEECPSVNPPK